MARTSDGALGRARTVWDGFTAGQRVVAALGLVILVGGGYVFSQWASQPSYAPLYSNLTGTDASAIVDKLNAANVTYELADGGNTVLVPRDRVYDLRLQMSGAGLPAGDQTGYALLDKQGITTSEFQQHIEYRRALEGELTKTVQAIQGVQGAVVHLAIPEKDVFADKASRTTASVLVDMGPGKDLSSQQVQAVTHLVSSSVEGLDPADVTVADSTGKVLSTGGDAGPSSSAGDARAQQTLQFENRVSSNVQEMLDRVVGTGNAVVKVSADLDFDQTATKTESYRSNPKADPLADTVTTEKYTGGAPGVGGVLGPDNIGVPNTATGAPPTSYDKRTTTRNNAVDKVVENRQATPGAVKRLSVAVLLNAKTAGTVNIGDVNKLVAGAVGVDTARGDTVAVSRLAFDTATAKRAAKELKDAEAAEKRAGLMGMAKNVGLGLVVFAILLLALISARKGRGSAGSGTVDVAELEEARRLLDVAVPARAAIGGGQSLALESGTSTDELRDVQHRAAVREEIGALVERQPEAVAQLLRTWLADRRG